ncbi:MAG: TonB-dependent receptor plug domain-containing protein [Pacificimonas sp.]
MRFASLLLLSASAVPIGAAMAQVAVDTDDEEIITTPLLNEPAPPAVTRLNADQLEVRYLDEPQAMARQVPNMVAVTPPGFGSGVNYTLRGLGDVGTYVDGVRLSKLTANHFGQFQLDRVDFERGPLATGPAVLSSAGAVNVGLHMPGTEVHGRFEGIYGEFDRLGFRGAIDMPSANDVFAITVDGYYEKTDGYVDNLTTGERLNDEDRWGGRFGIRLSPAANVDWFVNAAFLHDETLNLLNFECDDRCDDRFATTGLSEDRDTAFEGVSGGKARNGLGNETDTMLLTSNFNWRGNGIGLRLTTGYVNTDQDYAIDFADGRGFAGTDDGLPDEAGLAPGRLAQIGDEKLTEFSQDVALEGDIGGFSYVVGGALYQRDEEMELAVLRRSRFDLDRLQTLDQRSNQTVKGRALYAGFGYDLGAAELSAGLRYTDEDVDIRARTLDDSGFPGFDVEDGEGEWTGHVSGRLPLADGMTAFASARRGMTSAQIVPVLGITRGASTNWTYEGGVEAGLLDGMVNARLKGFYLDADDALNEQLGGESDLTNYGAEAEVTAEPLEGLNLFGSLGWQNADYDDFDIDPAYAPDVTAAGGLSYDWYIKGAESYLTPSIGFHYRGAMELDILGDPLIDTGGGQSADARVLVNAGLALRTDDDWWLVSVECENCLDETYVDSAFAGYGYLGRPMTWTLRARRQF